MLNLQAVHSNGGSGVGMNGAGAGHGGMGGKGQSTASGGMFYNLVTDPTEPGSNGKASGGETIGGGILDFEVSGTTTIDGNDHILDHIIWALS